MNYNKAAFSLLIVLLTFGSINAQTEVIDFNFELNVDKTVQDAFKPTGRIFIHFTSLESREPRTQSGRSHTSAVFSRNIKAWNGKSLNNEPNRVSGDDEKWYSTSAHNFKEILKGDYYVQAVWDQSGDLESRVNVPGNLYSKKVKRNAFDKDKYELSLSNVIPKRKFVNHALVKEFTLKSKLLSDWWKKDMEIKASVLLPANYAANPTKKYPVRYNVAGYGGRYTRINRLIANKEFMDWYTSDAGPEVITVFLDGEGPFGDSYQLDSENSGPYGEVLIKELIPQIEKTYRMMGTAASRFVDGCSTGGWVSLALQLYYPDSFNGCFSYSPDPVSFNKMQLINIYDDENAFYNKDQYLRPSRRDIYGEPSFSIKQEIFSENAQGSTSTYITSGQQWGAWNALYSPKGKDGLPAAIFDPHNGKIDKQVATHWKKYDLLKYTKSNWSTLGPKVQGKIYVWMGDMDNYYLNIALRDFDDFLKQSENPKSDAKIEFTPMKGHCTNYSHRKVFEAIQEKMKNG